MDVAAYLDRIGYRGSLNVDPKTLRELHRAHLFAVPFENLDILLGRPIVLSLPQLYDKIVRNRRGGFCYELNGLFAWLLEELGFRVVMLSARVFSGDEPGPDFDHMLLLEGSNSKWIADVGFGDSFVDPMPLGPEEQAQGRRSYRLSRRQGAWDLHQREIDGPWEPQYRFTITPRRLAEFEPMCRHQQTSPESVFTRKSVCSKATPDGRITLSNGRLIVTAGTERRERPIATTSDYRALLAEHFSMDLGAVTSEQFSRLLNPPARIPDGEA